MNSWGLRAHGLYPDDLHKYEIYGDRLYSPCNGIVRKAVDGFDDRLPSDFVNGLPEGTPAPGNYVLIDCDSVEVYIAHIQKGSVQVREGDVVERGELDWKCRQLGKHIRTTFAHPRGKERNRGAHHIRRSLSR